MHRLLPRLAATTTLFLALTGAASDLDQDIDGDQRESAGRTVLSHGHVDLGMLHRDGDWQLRLHDDTAVPSVWRPLDDVVLAVTDAAAREVPAEGFAFLDLEPGATAWVVPQTEAPGVVWVGWNTQDPGVLADLDRGVTLRVTDVTGPGAVTVYLQSGSFGEPDVLFSTREAYPQEAWIELNTHTHANWVFGAPGAYLVGIEFEGQTLAGETVTTAGALRFAVGDATDPDDAFALVATAAPAATPAAAATPDAPTDAAPWPWIVAGAVVAVALTGAVTSIVLSRRARREASRQPSDAAERQS